jgi:signal peptidase I
MNKIKQFAGTLIGILAIMYAGSEIPKRITVTISDSVNHRIFYKQTLFDQKDIKKGSYVMVELYSELVKCSPCLIVKRVAGVAGDLIVSRDLDYFCNGKYLGKAKTHSMTGKPLTSYKKNGLIPENTIFLMGDSPDSFDSRYYGPMELKHVKAIARPIF